MAGDTQVTSTNKTDECLSYPCSNGGSCNDEPGRYSCNCPVGFIGENCQLRGEPCSSNPCFHGATCQEMGDPHYMYSCLCPIGYTGRNCEQGNKLLHFIMFRIVNMTYDPDLGAKNTSPYRLLAKNIKSQIEAIYSESSDVGPHVIEITEIVFSKGSVVVKCTLALRVQIQQSVLDNILKKAINDKKLLPDYELSVISKEKVSVPNKTGKSSNNRTGLIVGCVLGVLGVLAVLGIVAAAVLLYRRQRARAAAGDSVEMITPDDDDDAESTK
ncbi:hypothetical protein LSAT2_017798 [Lamellibrachia satsuma]|nr:hypothetical protein LSAT2_017798 [Lamellibrachia satsuma]